MLLSEIFKWFGREFLEEDRDILTIKSPLDASFGELTFIDSEKYLKYLQDTKADVIILKKEHESHAPKGAILIFSQNPYLDIAYLTKFFVKPQITNRGREPRIAKSATVMPNVFIGKNSVIESGVSIMSGAYIGENCKIGKGSVIYPNVVLYRDTHIGENCIIHAGAVIGSDGFGYAHTPDGRHIKIYHLGSVQIDNDVEIGANSTIDRGVFGVTHIKEGVKIDNLVQIAHNCILGEHSLIASQSGLSGSTTTGRNVVFGGQCGTAGHQHIGDFAMFGAKSGIHGDIDGKKVYIGYPHLEQREWLRLQGKLLRLVRGNKKDE